MRTAFPLPLAVDVLGALLAPARCAACDAPVPRLSAFCPACASTAERDGCADAHDLAAFVYGGAVAQAIARLKYEERPDLARPLADLMWRAVLPHAAPLSQAVVVPVPLHRSRLVERGYNQAALLGRPLARRLGALFLPTALRRCVPTAQQATLTRAERIANVADAFRVRLPSKVGGRAILLVDDVRTTGATLGACALALSKAGALAVTTVVVARADRAQAAAT